MIYTIKKYIYSSSIEFYIKNRKIRWYNNEDAVEKEQKAIPNFSFDSFITIYTRENSKILNLLNEESNSKFVIK